MGVSNFFNPFIQFLDDDGKPLAFGRVQFLDPLTSESKTIWSDYEKTTPIDSNVVLDASGRCKLYAEGHYKVNLQRAIIATPVVDADWTTFDTIDPYVASEKSIVSNLNNPVYFDSVASFNTYDVTGNPTVAIVKGYSTAADGGEGIFFWKAGSTATVDTGMVFYGVYTSPGRWIRLMPNNGVLTPMMYGVFPNQSGSCSAGLTRMVSYAQANSENASVRIPTGNYPCSGTVTFGPVVNVDMDDNVTFSCLSGDNVVTVLTRNFRTNTDSEFCAVNGLGRMYLTWANDSTPDLAWFGTGANAKQALVRALNLSYNNSASLYVSAVTNADLDSPIYSFYHKILFRNKGSLSITSNLFMILKGYENQTAKPVFVDDINNIFISGQTADISDFTVIDSLDGSELYAIQNCITSGGTVLGELNWSRPITINGANGTSYSKWISNTFSGNGIVSTSTNAVSFGWVNAHPNRQCFSSASTALILTNKTSHLNWWATSYQSYPSALQCALNTGTDVDLDGNTVSTSSVITWNDYTSLRNGTISSVIAGAGTQAVSSNVTRIAKLHLENIDWDMGGVYNAERVLYVTAYDAKLKSCVFRNGVVSATGAKPYGATLTATYAFPRGQIIDNRFDYARLNLQQPDSFIVKGNWLGVETYEYSKTLISNPARGMYPAMNISALVNGDIIRNFICTDNDFSYYTGTGLDINLVPYSARMSCGNAIVDGTTAIKDNTGYRANSTDTLILSTEADIKLGGQGMNRTATNSQVAITAPYDLAFPGSHPSSYIGMDGLNTSNGGTLGVVTGRLDVSGSNWADLYLTSSYNSFSGAGLVFVYPIIHVRS